jgi:hypothetical protein
MAGRIDRIESLRAANGRKVDLDELFTYTFEYYKYTALLYRF